MKFKVLIAAIVLGAALPAAAQDDDEEPAAGEREAGTLLKRLGGN